MDIFEHIAASGHEQVVFCSNPEVGLQAIIAIHSTALGPGLGGVRMWPFKSYEEAVRDVLRLSRGMTYKAAAAGLNLGGAKAVILGDAKKDKTEALLRCFGTYVESLGGLYITAEDVGTSMADMEMIHAESRWVTGISPAQGGSGDPSPVTAYGTLQGMKAAVNWHFGSPKLDGKTVLIQGLGNVGYHLAKYLIDDEGAKVVGCDIDAERSERAAGIGVAIVAPEQLIDQPGDVFAPCALGGAINDDSIPRLQCPVIAGGANNQLADEERHGRELHARGILYAPDFVINAGGLINVYNEITGYNRERALHMTRGIYQNITRIFEIAKKDGIPTYAAAERMAEERIERVKRMRPQRWGRQFVDRRPRVGA